jgi:hypothetical protein
MPEYKGTIEVTFTADDEDQPDVHLLECADYLENASLVLSATARTIEKDLRPLIERLFRPRGKRPRAR